MSAFRHRAMDPEHPAIRGTAQNPDIYFQNREAPNAAYDALPGIVQKNMDALAGVCGRQYHLFDYVGAADAERVIVTMASSCETVEATVRALVDAGEKVGRVRPPWPPCARTCASSGAATDSPLRSSRRLKPKRSSITWPLPSRRRALPWASTTT